MPNTDDPAAASIWTVRPTLEQLNALSEDTLATQLGIVFTDVGPDFVRGTMPVDARTRQPFGVLHGGASVAFAETLGSAAANFCVDPDRSYCVGLDINANHVRPIREGEVMGTARPLHRGRTTHVWEIHIRDAADRLVCVSRLTLAVLDQS